MRTITLEEHYVTHDFLRATSAHEVDATAGMEEIRTQLLDLGEGRIAAMDEAGIDVQVLSLAAIGMEALHANEQTAVLRGVHDEVAATVKSFPDRFRAFATPGLKDPKAAVKEVERCVRELGFVGVLLNGTTENKFLDAPEFFPVLETIAALGVPLYVHPAPPPSDVHAVYYSGLPHGVGYPLSIAGWGWHIETGLHALRLIVSGVLDRLPGLQVIVGHMGEGVPYALARSSAILSGPAKLQQSVADTFKTRFHVTTSGYFTRPPFECARAVLGFEHLMYSVDYPFSSNTRGVTFLQSLNLQEADEAALRGGHAAELLRL